MDLLLLVRGFAAVAVVLWHTVGYHGLLPPLVNLPGRIAVWVFFGISGYVISHGFAHRRYSYTATSLLRFYRNRFLRIAPLFLLLTAVAWATAWVTSGQPAIGWTDVPAQVFMCQFNQAYTLVGVFWTLGIEIHFYLVAPVVALLLLIPGDGWRLLASLGVYLVALSVNHFGISHGWWSYDGRNIVANAPHFLAGIVGIALTSALLAIRVPLFLGRIPAARVGFWAGLLAAVGMLAYGSWLYQRHPTQFWSETGIVVTDLAIVLLIVAHVAAERGGCAPKRRLVGPLALLGTLSYGIYAWHAYLLQYLFGGAERFLPLLAVSVLTAYISYRLIEAPALALRRRGAERLQP
jgi:peptidoglycan/LPS O-acetylase OafA/YrhL